MTFWRPAYEWRGTRRVWFTSARLQSVVMSELAAKAIYQRFNLIPDLVLAANDRDHLKW